MFVKRPWRGENYTEWQLLDGGVEKEADEFCWKREPVWEEQNIKRQPSCYGTDSVLRTTDLISAVARFYWYVQGQNLSIVLFQCRSKKVNVMTCSSAHLVSSPSTQTNDAARQNSFNRSVKIPTVILFAAPGAQCMMGYIARLVTILVHYFSTMPCGIQWVHYISCTVWAAWAGPWPSGGGGLISMFYHKHSAASRQSSYLS